MATGAYMFRSEPQAVQARAKYRDPGLEADFGKQNIHYDRRVVRGNTYAAQVPTLAQQRAAEIMASEYRRKTRTAEVRRQRSSRRQLNHTRGYGDSAINVPGRQHMTVQTDDYLEELVDKVFEADVKTQTEMVEDEDIAPLFVPKAAGKSVGTMVEPGELFDFDLGVEPILEVLIGKSLDQGLNEVLEEEELKLLRRHKEAFEHKRNTELAEVQRLEAASKRKFDEKERRLAQERERMRQKKEIAQKIAARTTAKDYLAGLSFTILDRLERSGHFYDPTSRQVEGHFMPWLVDSVAERLSALSNSRSEVDQLVAAAIRKLQFDLSEVDRKEREQRAEDARLKAEHEAEIQRLKDEIKREEETEQARVEAAIEAARQARLAREAEEAAVAAALLEEEDEDGGDGDGSDNGGDDGEEMEDL